MIKAISSINSYKTNHKIENNLGYNSAYMTQMSLSKDVFQLSKNNPSFGANAEPLIPKAKIFALCDEALEIIRPEISDNELATGVGDIMDKIINLLRENRPKRSKAEEDVFSNFRHELSNFIQGVIGEAEIYPFRDRGTQRNKIIADVNRLKKQTRAWDSLYKNGTNLEIGDVFKLLKNLNKSHAVSWEGEELLSEKVVQNHMQLYSLLSQPLLNAIKYGEEKPVKVVIEQVEKSGKKQLYASFINPETKPIPDSEIDKILEGQMYRAEATKEIYGTGFGFPEMIKILRLSGHEDDIPKLIEKGRENGVCVRVPIIGVEE